MSCPGMIALLLVTALGLLGMVLFHKPGGHFGPSTGDAEVRDD